jgi:hypothetical protein
VRFLWGGTHTLINVEHDHECSDDLIQELLDCPEPLCSHAYTLFMPSTGGLPHYAHRTGPKPPAGGEWIKQGDEWADFGGIGFCKITPQARVRPLAQSSWQVVDCAISKATDARWHVHWQQGPSGPVGVEHYHYE